MNFQKIYEGIDKELLGDEIRPVKITAMEIYYGFDDAWMGIQRFKVAVSRMIGNG